MAAIGKGRGRLGLNLGANMYRFARKGLQQLFPGKTVTEVLKVRIFSHEVAGDLESDLCSPDFLEDFGEMCSVRGVKLGGSLQSLFYCFFKNRPSGSRIV